MMAGSNLKKAIRINLYKMIGRVKFNQSIYRVDLNHQKDKVRINLSKGSASIKRFENRIKV